MTIRRPSVIDVLLILLGLSLWIGKGVDLGFVNVRPLEFTAVLLMMVILAQSAVLPQINVKRKYTKNPIVSFILSSIVLIVVAATASTVNAIDSPAVIRFAARYVLGAALLWGLLNVLVTRYRIYLLVCSVLAGAVVSVGISVIGILVPEIAGNTIRYGDRAQALLNHPNQFAMLLVSIVPLALAIVLARPRRLGPWLTLSIVVFGVALTGSKANLFFGAIGLIVTAVLATRLQRKFVKRVGLSIGLTAGILILAFLAYLTVDAVSPRTLATIGSLIEDPEQVTAVTSRVAMWETAIALGVQHPWTGIGAANTIHYLQYDHAHNVLIEFFMTLGVPGTVALLLLLLSILYLVCAALWSALTAKSVSFGKRLMAMALSVGVLSYILANQSSDSFGGTTLPMLWVLISLLVAQLRHIAGAKSGNLKSPARRQSLNVEYS